MGRHFTQGHVLVCRGHQEVSLFLVNHTHSNGGKHGMDVPLVMDVPL